MKNLDFSKKSLDILKKEGFIVFIIKVYNFAIGAIVKNVFMILILPVGIIYLKYKKFDKLESYLDFSFEGLFGIIRPMQIRQELFELINSIIKENPQNILEIGTANGGTLFLLSKISNRQSTVISIDMPYGKFGGGYPKWKSLLYKSFSSNGQSIYLLRMDSHEKKTLENVKKLLYENKLDILFIDGDHSYNGVKKDFQMYGPLVKNQGLIIFHDIVHGHEDLVGGVPKMWQEIKNKYEFREIVNDWNQGGFGLGIIKINQK